MTSLKVIDLFLTLALSL